MPRPASSRLYALVQETAADIDHSYQAGVLLGGSEYIRAMELEATLFEFAERVVEQTDRTVITGSPLRLVVNG